MHWIPWFLATHCFYNGHNENLKYLWPSHLRMKISKRGDESEGIIFHIRHNGQCFFDSLVGCIVTTINHLNKTNKRQEMLCQTEKCMIEPSSNFPFSIKETMDQLSRKWGDNIYSFLCMSLHKINGSLKSNAIFWFHALAGLWN